MPNQTEEALLEQARLALETETGLGLSVAPALRGASIQSEDSRILLAVREHCLPVKITRNIRPANIGSAIMQVKALGPQAILVADYVNANIAKTLKEHNVQYMDCCGNAYLNLPPIFVHISGQKPQVKTSQSKNRAFNVSGLKLIYGFLCNEALINASYRDMSEKTGVALGAIGTLLCDLRDSGYLLNGDDLRWHGLTNKKKLLDRWVEAYSEKLKPKLFVGDYVSDDANWWSKIDIENFGAYWGGEVAAAKYTDYLRPQVTTLYLPEESGNKIFAAARLRKAVNINSDTEGLVKIYRPFWPSSLINSNQYIPNPERYTVNPVLIYADLITSQDSRNFETAGILYETTIAGLIGEG